MKIKIFALIKENKIFSFKSKNKIATAQLQNGLRTNYMGSQKRLFRNKADWINEKDTRVRKNGLDSQL